jgi:hypothetical protein
MVRFPPWEGESQEFVDPPKHPLVPHSITVRRYVRLTLVLHLPL